MSDLELGLQAGRRSYEEILKQRQDEGGHKTATTNEQVKQLVLVFVTRLRILLLCHNF